MREGELLKFYFLDEGKKLVPEWRVDSKANDVARGFRITGHKLREMEHLAELSRDKIMKFQ